MVGVLTALPLPHPIFGRGREGSYARMVQGDLAHCTLTPVAAPVVVSTALPLPHPIFGRGGQGSYARKV